MPVDIAGLYWHFVDIVWIFLLPLLYLVGTRTSLVLNMSERILSPTVYYLVFAALIGLTAVTVGVSFLDLGPWHTAAGLAIAVCKALLVAMFFMHVLQSGRLTWW